MSLYISDLSVTIISFHLGDGQHPFGFSYIAKVMNTGDKLIRAVRYTVYRLNIITIF